MVKYIKILIWVRRNFNSISNNNSNSVKPNIIVSKSSKNIYIKENNTITIDTDPTISPSWINLYEFSIGIIRVLLGGQNLGHSLGPKTTTNRKQSWSNSEKQEIWKPNLKMKPNPFQDFRILAIPKSQKRVRKWVARVRFAESQSNWLWLAGFQETFPLCFK